MSEGLVLPVLVNTSDLVRGGAELDKFAAKLRKTVESGAAPDSAFDALLKQTKSLKDNLTQLQKQFATNSLELRGFKHDINQANDAMKVALEAKKAASKIGKEYAISLNNERVELKKISDAQRVEIETVKALNAQKDLLAKNFAKMTAAASPYAQKVKDTTIALNAMQVAEKEEIRLSSEIAKLKAQATPAVQKLREEYEKQLAATKQLTEAQRRQLAIDKEADKLKKQLLEIEARRSATLKTLQQEVAKATLEEQKRNAASKLTAELQAKIAIAEARRLQPIKDLQSALDKLTASEARATRGQLAFGASANALNQATASSRAALQALGAGFGIYTSGTILAAAATYGFITQLKAIIQVGSAFTGELARVNAVMGLTEWQFESVKTASIDLASSTQFMATEVAQAFR